MSPLGSEFEKFIKTVTKFMEQYRQHVDFLSKQLINTQIELDALKRQLENKNDTAKN